MTAPAPLLPLEARRAIWERLWRECLLRPRDTPADDELPEAPPAPASKRHASEMIDQLPKSRRAS